LLRWYDRIATTAPASASAVDRLKPPAP
jgi:hypothetical protein